jgi:hypothetical protein
MRFLLGLGAMIAACSSAGGPDVAHVGADGAAGESAGASSEASAGAEASAGSAAALDGEGGGSGEAGAHSSGQTPVAAGGHEGDPVGGGAGAAAVDPLGGAGGNGGLVPCTETAFYADTDRDGFGDPKAKATACVVPRGHVANATDCDDNDPQVHPGQLEWFALPRANGSFDYDCSGAEELRYPTFTPCPDLDNSCPPPNHWPDGFECDYLGMMAPYSQPEAGWRNYTYAVCSQGNCTQVPVEIPDCGEVGRAGKPPLGWDVASQEYTCSPMPYLPDDQIAKLAKRTQVCR